MTRAAYRSTPTGHQAAPGEFRGLTGLRILAAVWVAAFHFHFTALPGVERIDRFFGPLLTQGALGVDLFFVLSGFVIAHTYLDRLAPRPGARAAARFLWARIARMWPVYALVFHVFGLWLVAKLVLGHDRVISFQGVQPVVGVGPWLQQLFGVQMWNERYLDGASWVGPTWSLSAEWLAYLLFPLTAAVFWRLRRLPAPVLATAAVVVMTPVAAPYVVIGGAYYPYSWLVRILCGFSAGALMLLAHRRSRSTERSRRRASAVGAALPLVVAAGLLAGEWAGPGRGGVVVVTFPLLVAAIARADRGPVRMLGTAWMVRGGRASYCLYLVHIPLFEVYWTALQHGLTGRAAYVVGAATLLASMVVAVLLHRLVEEPARKRLGRIGPGRPPVDREALAAERAARAMPRPRHAAWAERRPAHRR